MSELAPHELEELKYLSRYKQAFGIFLPYSEDFPPLLPALEQFEKVGVPIVKWGVKDGGVRLPVTSLGELAEKAQEEEVLYLKVRNKKTRLDIYIEFGWSHYFLARGRGTCADLCNLFRAILPTLLPAEFAVCNGFRQPWSDLEAQGLSRRQGVALAWMMRNGMMAPVTWKAGPSGISQLTYVGPPILEKLGEDRVRQAPCLVEKLGDGYLLSLAEDPCALPPAELADRWQAVVDHFVPAHVFALLDKQSFRVRNKNF